MKTHILGYPRIGSKRELKKACEQYWSGKISTDELKKVGADIKNYNWNLQKEAGIDLVTTNDFSYYDQVLDMTLTVNAIPEKYKNLDFKSELDLYFAMARGHQKNNIDVPAMEMTKWFDTNYHYIVPEFKKEQKFNLFSTKVIDEFQEAKKQGIITKPVLIGSVSYLLLGKEKEEGFHRIDLITNLLPVYFEILNQLEKAGAEWIQFDEPFLALDLTDKEKTVIAETYTAIQEKFPKLKIIVATYFEGLQDNLKLAINLPVNTLHIDLVRYPNQLQEVLENAPKNLSISLGIVDGRNVWKNDYQQSLSTIQKAVDMLGKDRVLISTSCSSLHVPCDLENENNEDILTSEIKNWLAFAKQKVNEVVTLKQLFLDDNTENNKKVVAENREAIESKKTSSLINNPEVKYRVTTISDDDAKRKSPFSSRKIIQNKALNLPLYPTTTIGSFPQTKEVRSWRSKFKKEEISQKEYEDLLKKETEKAIRWQEEIDIDVLVHGEFERNDMVEYFGEKLNGFVFTKFGWVQSYGSRCVKPPIIFGDISRPNPMTVKWTSYAQSLTPKLVKGMLTGPVTILQWSFVRNDQERSVTCNQIALAIRDEVKDLENVGIKIIQIDEPAIREGLPLRKSDWQRYLKWAINAFKISSSGINDETQIHTHMCYSEFNDIIQNIADMDADVITIECSRSQMELLDAFADFNYPNEIGPGVYDIHSPRVPNKDEMVLLLNKAKKVIPKELLWVNPDCGLKTRGWDETKKALTEMVTAAKTLREKTVSNTI
ncbi:5-methyltetrahydropteroyltriglutamate--homocysteine methyltransferase [Lutibacter profundi]|uniref:5-methyltetrahydropteroyltriglutamate--homocysteine methyltransferase n=1 Tax=Lutibacter profundi TaxID=1622118 RepID=A0A109RN84_9FLAO|nr:5-methyltetrahydropteroyltriglutamate--homocysteine S-methyltransferase [Lutibacter profundi]AMC10300.1 5-methyltetrahydropteroyltriglutamate--homocysteine methyltransferase [Lutibacter profundi]